MKKKEETIIRGFKGFNKDLTCNKFQFEIGKTFKHEGKIELCSQGFHFCEHPLNVFSYYPPSQNRFCEVEGSGEIAKADDDTKVVCSEINIKAEVSFHALVDAAVKFVFERAKWTKKNTVEDEREAASATGVRGAASATGVRGAASATGVRGAASATGDQGAASATGDQGAASATGYQGAASATGVRGAAVALGWEAKAKGAVGCWLTIAEWKETAPWKYERIDVQTVKVDGKTIKADTFYMLKEGKFVEA